MPVVPGEVAGTSAASRREGLGLPAPRPPELRALGSLRLYQPRWVWPPSFEGTHEWRVLREDIVAHGIRTPLRILRNGWVIDGTHRYRIATALGLETVPVQVVPIPLERSDADPLSPLDRLRIERTAVLEALARRHLTRHQRDVLFLTLEAAQASGLGPLEVRTARRLANLRRGPARSDEPPTAPSLDEIARLYDIPVRRLQKLLTLARRGDGEVRAQFTRGAVPLERAYAATVAGDRDGDPLDPFVGYVTPRLHVMVRMVDCWAACPSSERGIFLDEFVCWLDRFEASVEAVT
jgi:hypothetical protein